MALATPLLEQDFGAGAADQDYYLVNEDGSAQVGVGNREKSLLMLNDALKNEVT